MRGEPVSSGVVDGEGDATVRGGGGVGEGALDFGETEGDDVADGGGGEGVEDDLFVEAVDLRAGR